MQRHTISEIVYHSRSTALERSVKTLLGGFNRFCVATTLARSSAVVYTRHLFSPREGFLTHQCYISENIKIKRIQKKKTMRTRHQEIPEMLKETQQLDSDGPDQSQNFRHQLTYLKVFRPEPSQSLRPDPPACNQRGKQTLCMQMAKIQNSIRIQMRRSREINQIH